MFGEICTRLLSDSSVQKWTEKNRLLEIEVGNTSQCSIAGDANVHNSVCQYSIIKMLFSALSNVFLQMWQSLVKLHHFHCHKVSLQRTHYKHQDMDNSLYKWRQNLLISRDKKYQILATTRERYWCIHYILTITDLKIRIIRQCKCVQHKIPSLPVFTLKYIQSHHMQLELSVLLQVVQLLKCKIPTEWLFHIFSHVSNKIICWKK